MSWLGLNHFVAVKAALGTQEAAARFLNVGGETSISQAEDSVEMADADNAADRSHHHRLAPVLNRDGGSHP